MNTVYIRLDIAKIIIAAIVTILFMSCQNNSKQYDGNPLTENHLIMRDLLDSISRYTDPMECYNLNSQRAELLKTEVINEQDPNIRIQKAFRYSQELLNAGDTDQTIAQVLSIVEALGGMDNVIKEDNYRVIAELLAIAYLRKGEIENCVINHTAASCILPIQDEGVHEMRIGSEKASEILEQLLTSKKDDKRYQHIWLYNIAEMTLGAWPSSVPAAMRLPERIFKPDESLLPIFRDIAIPLGLDKNGLSGGVCIEDFDNDGYLDIFITSYGLDHNCALFKNNGDGTFTDITYKANLNGIVSGLNTIHADYNNDGFMDILILRGGWLNLGGKHPNSLLRNNGDGTFTDVTIEAGLLSFHPTQTAAWADFDQDGHVDLFIGNETLPGNENRCEFYRNNGDGTFTEISEEVGINISEFVKGVTWGDINNDGYPDLYISILGGYNKLFLNPGKSEEKFKDISIMAGVSEPLYSFPTWFFDYNQDGYLDLFVGGYDNQRLDKVALDAASEYIKGEINAETPRIFRNNGNNTFDDVTSEVGLNKVMYGMGANFGDINGDGYPDFYIGTGAPEFTSIVPNRMFLNDGKGAFNEVSANGFAHIQKGHGIAFADLDQDGDLDIYAVMGGAFEGDHANNVLFENPTQGKNRWIQVSLVSSDHQNTIGTKIEADIIMKNGTSEKRYTTIGTGGSFGANPIRAYLGLGDAKSLERLVIKWSGNGEETLSDTLYNVEMDNIYVHEQGKSNMIPSNAGPVKLNTSKRHTHHHH